MSAVGSVEQQNWIVALFIRDDGQRLILGDGAFEFKEGQQHFAADDLSNTVIDVQGGDGSLLSGQVRRASVQSFDGYIGDAGCSKVQIEAYRRQFLTFFRPNHLYETVYVFTDGSAVKRQRGFLVEMPSVQELWQIYPEYHVGMSYEDVNYYNYIEGPDGSEIYGQLAIIPPATNTIGGFVWDEVGLVWDNVGAVCDGGAVGNTIILNNGTSPIYPIITFVGPTAEPKLENLATGESIQITGKGIPPRYDEFSIAAGQKIVIDTLNQTATYYPNPDEPERGQNILTYLKGDWLTLTPGRNELVYSTSNQNAVPMRLEWPEIAW